MDWGRSDDRMAWQGRESCDNGCFLWHSISENLDSRILNKTMMLTINLYRAKCLLFSGHLLIVREGVEVCHDTC